MSFNKLTNAMWKLQVIGWLVYFLLMFLSFLSRETDESIGYIFLVKSFRAMLGFLLSYLLWMVYSRIINKYSMPKIAIVVASSTLLLGIVWTILETLFFVSTLATYNLSEALQYKPRAALTYSVTLLAWSAIYFGIEYWKQVQQEHQYALQAKLMAQSAKLEMLRYQINPHFLFNALNSIRASISPDNQASKQMITQLSEFLRHSLLSKNSVCNTLSQELEAIENYLAIEKVRFEEALNVTFDIDEKAKAYRLPSFLLNPLVENAIKHGFKSNPEVLCINISAKYKANGRLIIEIANTGTLDNDGQASKSAIGLKNVQARLDMHLPNKSYFTLFQKDSVVVAKIEIETNDL